MAFADPQSVTLNAVAISLPKTGLGSGEYQANDGTVKMTIRPQQGKRLNTSVQIKQSKLVSDPNRPADNIPVSGAVTLAANFPIQGFSAAEKLDLVKGMLANLTASSDTNLKKLLGLEA
jgi:hypothetical protein